MLLVDTKPTRSTEIIAPAEAIPRSPKLSFSEDLLSLLRTDIPAASVTMNGTVIAPVVAPEASKEIASNSLEEKRERISIIP